MTLLFYRSGGKQDGPPPGSERADPSPVAARNATDAAAQAPTTTTAGKAKRQDHAGDVRLAGEIKEYGVQEGKPIDAGFVFFDGRYIEAPYVVARKGLCVYINETLVFRHAGPVAVFPGDVDPQLPPDLTQDTSFYDKSFSDYMRQKVAYVQKHFKREEEIKIMEQVYRGLPCVTEAHLDAEVPTILHITTFRGESIPIGLDPPRRKAPQDKASVLAQVEGVRKNYEERLHKGDCFFLFDAGGRISFGAARVAQCLPRIAEILRSQAPTDVKVKKLQQEGMPDLKSGSFAKLITSFSASSQLDERLRKPQGPSETSAQAGH
jgi:hypothetical protein